MARKEHVWKVKFVSSTNQVPASSVTLITRDMNTLSVLKKIVMDPAFKDIQKNVNILQKTDNVSLENIASLDMKTTSVVNMKEELLV